MIRSLVLSLLSLLIGGSASRAQAPVFQPPLDIAPSLSGNFMELRSGHFHSGLDLRTDGREGLAVKAAADGWVSRVKVSPWGYGKALYIDHPNGHTTVYGHLRNYTGAIADAVLDAQYKAKKFDLDITFPRDQLKVRAGDVVAISGNTGGSSGPHLHFEVRRTSDQHALDPERYGMDVPDTVPPTFIGLRIDPLDSIARVPPYPGRAKGYPLILREGVYALKDGFIPMALGKVGLSVHVIDRYSNNWSTCGIRSLRVRVDGEPAFSAELNEVDFDRQRFADAYMDHALYKESDMYYNRCYKLPNNPLAIYGDETAQGRIDLEPGSTKRVSVEAVDANGNRSLFTFQLKGATTVEAARWPTEQKAGQLFRWDHDNTLTIDGLRFTLPAKSLYADERIGAHVLRKDGTFADSYQLHDPLTPLNQYGTVSLRVRPGSAKGKEGKLLLVRIDEKGKTSPLGGTFAEGWVSARIRNFGGVTVLIDTLPPKITPLNMRAVMTGKDSLRFEVGDDLSGVETWRAELDGQWILLEYDPKKKQVFHRFDNRTDKPGKHDLRVELTDERGNTAEYRASFVR